MREKPPSCDRAWIWPTSASYGSPSARFSPLAAELGEDFFVVLAERGRGRVDARTAMGEGERRQWHAKPAVDPMTGGVAVNDAARCQLRIGKRLAHGAHARGRHVARLQEFLHSSAVRVNMSSER